MCYVIEFTEKFQPGTEVQITVKTLPNIHVKELNVFLTAKYDYIGLLSDHWDEHIPFKINLPFGKDQTSQIISKPYESLPLMCNPDFEFLHQCQIHHFIEKNSCNTKVKRQYQFSFTSMCKLKI